MQKIFGLILICVGVGLLVLGQVQSYVVIHADETPPIIYATVPSDGTTYQADTITVVAVETDDPESGIAAAQFRFDNGDPYSMVLSHYVNNHPLFICNLETLDPPARLDKGDHTFTFTVTNNNELPSSVTGTFTIYADLQGNWYINNILITSPDQEVRVTTLALTFKFVKTTGVDDSGISCRAKWSGPEPGSTVLENIIASTWQATYTFSTGGTYDVTLTASDGTKLVTMSILNVYMGDGGIIPDVTPVLQNIGFTTIIGLASTLIGIVLIALPQKH